MLIAYRIAYGLVLAIFLGNVAIAIGERPSGSTFVLLVVAAIVLLSIFGLLVRFSRTQPTIFWVLVLTWGALFVWYAWFSPASPFALHEAHALDSGAVARESTAHYLKAGTLFGVLFAWFLSLPVVRKKWKGTAVDV
jgi:glucan phosphoethanolaminetransferase (alkaline phosphatase superfamily)